LSEGALYTAAQTRELDRIAIEDFGIPGIQLMSRAGRAAFELLRRNWPEETPLSIFCGTGNNGGDGFVVARLARDCGIPVVIYQLGDGEKIRGDAARARAAALEVGVEVVVFAAGITPAAGVIVDALLGTGLTGEVRGDYVTAIEAINAAGGSVLAVDIPSGLCSDTGRCLGSAVRADMTITFIGVKRGLLTGDAPGYCGELHFADLAVPPGVYERVAPASRRLELDLELESLPEIAATAHKGSFGHALVVGGDLGMGGAALMASEAAARCGAGLVSAATRTANVPAFNARRPEVMAHGVESRAELEPLLARASAVAVGTGLGQSAWAEQLLQRVSESDLPLVLDADALNLLASQRAVADAARGNWILTPHPGEAARLLDTETTAVNADRFAAASAIQARFGGTVVLKGAGTLVADGHSIDVCPYGNPGMASGGMGDVLSGVLVALLAQGLSSAKAARLGVCLHSVAADLVAQEEGMRGLLATDLTPVLQQLIAD
jgi:NAD(P)H-hydrate epimerase